MTVLHDLEVEANVGQLRAGSVEHGHIGAHAVTRRTRFETLHAPGPSGISGSGELKSPSLHPTQSPDNLFAYNGKRHIIHSLHVGPVIVERHDDRRGLSVVAHVLSHSHKPYNVSTVTVLAFAAACGWIRSEGLVIGREEAPLLETKSLVGRSWSMGDERCTMRDDDRAKN